MTAFFWWSHWTVRLERIEGLGWTSLTIGPLVIVRPL